MSMQGQWRITINASGQREISVDLEPDGALRGEICLDHGDDSEFRAVPWDSSTAC